MAQGAGAPYDFHTKFSVPSNALSTDLQFKYDRPDPPTQLNFFLIATSFYKYVIYNPRLLYEKAFLTEDR